MITTDLNNKIQYVSSGLFKSAGEWIHPRRIIDSHEIIFITEGTAYISEDEIEFTLNANDILVLEPGKEHFGYLSSIAPVSFFWLHFNWSGNNCNKLPKQFHIENSFHIKTLFSQLLHIANTPDYSDICPDLLTALIIEEILFQTRTSTVLGSSLAVQIKEWIRININSDINVKKVATNFGYHENYIGKIFKSAYNIGIKEYITDSKLKNAKNLLSTSLYTIKQIAYMTGFENENHFIKFFKYHAEMTPTEYRNIYTNTHINKK
jgi:AraC-like DNA-binding protein